MQRHEFSFEVDATPEEIWAVLHPRPRRLPPGEHHVIEHGGVRIEIIHPGDENGEGLVRTCTFAVPRLLGSGGVGRSWECVSEVRPFEYARYDAVGKPLWSEATGWHRLHDLGGGRVRVEFGETYHAFNLVARVLLERYVHRFISRDNDRLIRSAIEGGVARMREPSRAVTAGAVDALQADRDALIAICRTLADEQWSARSAWAGWTVQGLVSHLAGGFWRVVDPATLPDTAGMTTQQAQDAIVASRQSWTSERVLDDYISVSGDAIARLARLTDQQAEISFGDLGTHPISMVANSFAFDHYTHIRSDLCAPRGPLDARPPPSDELRLVAALDWISAALPQQNAPLIDSWAGSLVIEVSPPGARTIVVGAGPERGRVVTDPVSLIRWVTQRNPWADLEITASGDDDVLAIARQLAVA